MSIKPSIVRGLLRSYPPRWRAEYGEELGALLSDRPITPSVLLDVAASALREHWKLDPVWTRCGLCLFAWTVAGILLNNTAPLSRENFERYKMLWQFGVLLTGCWTVLRNRDISPTGAAVKAALLGALPEMAALMLWAAGVFHPLVTTAEGPYPLVESRLALFYMAFPTVPNPGWGVFPLEIGVIVGQACVFGFLGGIVGRVCRSLYRQFAEGSST